MDMDMVDMEEDEDIHVLGQGLAIDAMIDVEGFWSH
jgi:hypothetical protein